MFVVHFMGPSNAFCVFIICVSEPFKTLVYKDVVYHEISKAIGHNTQSNGPSLPESSIFRRHYKAHTNDRIKNKESIISLEPAVVVFFVVIRITPFAPLEP